MKKYALYNKHGEIISKHKNLDLANKALRKKDSVQSTLYGTDVDWLDPYDQNSYALQGYNYQVRPLKS